MKLVLVLALLGACSIEHRSQDFTCTNQSQCDPGQTCSDGLCITGGVPTDGPGVDPDGPIRPDAFVCPAPCTSCNQGTNTCTVDCNVQPAACGAAINCPAGFNCNILCTRNDLCSNINCSQGQSCKIECKGNSTCDNVVCGEAKCEINCIGGMACRAVACNDSCACDVACGNNASCLQVSCPEPGNDPFQCSDFGLNRCDSAPDGCNTCGM